MVRGELHASADSIKNVGIVGFGTMGVGLAQVFALHGFNVTAMDIRREALTKGLESLRNGRFGLNEGVKKSKITERETDSAFARIRVTSTLDELNQSDFIVENVYENLEVKRKLFAELDRLCDGDVILSTDTSSISVTRIAEMARRPERIVGMHFFNPPQVMELVEVISGTHTSPKVASRTEELSVTLGKTPIMVRDKPGFAAARLGLSLFVEACRALEEGVASVEDIDKSMKLGFGHPMGPFELTDLIGLDIRLSILNEMWEETGEQRWKPPPVLKQLVEAGYLGDPKLKPGSKGGFYSFFKTKK